MRIVMTSDNGRMRTRITTYDEIVRIDSMVFSDHEISSDVPIAIRKWKDKWFAVSTAIIPNCFIVSMLRKMNQDQKFTTEIAKYIETIFKQNEEKIKKGE